MVRKVFKILLCSVLLLSTPASILAEEADGTSESSEPDYSDDSYWSNLCVSSGLSAQQKSSCVAYMQYRSNASESLRDRLSEIETSRQEIAENIKTYAALVQEYNSQATSLNGEIADLNGQISVSEKKIEELEERIQENQEQIEAAEDKVKNRMVSAQETMRLNRFLDILMGATSFDELIRIANGLSDITAYDTRTMESLAGQIEQMNQDKMEVEAEKQELDDAKSSVVAKQNEYLALKYQAQVVEEEYQKQSADLEAEGNRVAANIEEIQKQMAEIANALNEVSATAGWVYPVPGISINPYAGTWYYSSGGVHLGADFSGAQGSAVVAVGNGVILNSADGCDYGYLGSSCGAQYGGSSGGGNQVYLLTKINGGLYAVKYLHLLAGSPVAKGTIVVAGQTIGKVGSSGNSTGPHCHIEVFYLGDAINFSNYAQKWNGDLAFGCGWGSAALNRLCENGVGAPCRVKPESLFG